MTECLMPSCNNTAKLVQDFDGASGHTLYCTKCWRRREMSVVETVVGLYKAMSKAEKTDLMFELSSLAVRDGLVDMSKAKGVGKVSHPPKKRGFGKSKKKYWVKSVTGFDAKEKGVMQIAGTWVDDVLKDTPDNSYYIVGFRQTKHYMLCHVDGSGKSVVENDGVTVDINGSMIFEADNFKDLCARVEKLFA